VSPAQVSSRLLIGPLSPAAGGPLYTQIIDSLKREISEGRLAPGAALPSFRQLAEDLLVSVITVKRAYEELERDGIIYRRQGLGTFVADAAADRSREVKTAHAAALFRQGAREAAEAGLSQKAIIQLAEAAIQQDADDNPATSGAPRHVRKRA
jgi:GntR family transcriptional regulator